MFNRSKKSASSAQLIQEAAQLRKEALGTPPGIARDHLMRRARQAETAALMQDWLASPGLKPPVDDATKTHEIHDGRLVSKPV
jgi:hypothetical protein